MQADWQKGFEAGQKLRARILYVDSASKRVCLTLLPHLISGQAAPALPKANTLFQVRTPAIWPYTTGIIDFNQTMSTLDYGPIDKPLAFQNVACLAVVSCGPDGRNIPIGTVWPMQALRGLKPGARSYSISRCSRCEGTCRKLSSGEWMPA